MSCTLRAIVHYVSRALHTLVPLIPPALRAFVCHRRGVPSAFLPYKPRALFALVLHVPLVSHVPRGVSAIVPHMSCGFRPPVPHVLRTLYILVPHVLRTSFSN